MRWGAVAIVGAMVLAACGARTGLGAPPTPKGSNQFCVRSDFGSGYSDLSLYVLLDRSGSMSDANKWTSATAALSAFVDDPSESGLGIGLQFFPVPFGDKCSSDTYAQPAVTIGLLPGVASAMKAALAKTSPNFGETPLAEALRGGVEYVRGVRLADPTRDVAIAVVTDGLPEGCANPSEDQAVRAVEDVATNAFTSDPSVLVFIVGLASGYVDKMNAMAAAGGTGKAILIDTDPNTAQNIVNALNDLRDTLRKCRFAIPPVGAANLTPADLTVSYRLSPQDPSTILPLFASAADCGGGDGFIVDDPNAPKRIQLCPSTCTKLHTQTASKVNITAGCGAGAPDGGARDGGEGGTGCSNSPDVACYADCTSKIGVSPVCAFGEWSCPSGSVVTSVCDCPAVPHGCCHGDGTYSPASCVNAQWTCGAGDTSFGSPNCTPPAECAPLLPCGPQTYCRYPDFSCGGSNVLGQCVAPGTNCTANVQACGCNGQVFPSDCDAASQGIDVVDSSNCAAPSGTFGCGPFFCHTNSEVCKKTIDLNKTVAATNWACIPASPACPTGCGCNSCQPCPAGHSACNEVCTTDGNGGRILTCTELP